MDIILAASEAHPFIKTGGMGDVVGALWKFLPRRGFRVRLFLPASPHLFEKYAFEEMNSIDFTFADQMNRARYFLFQEEEREVIMVDGEGFFNRDRMYGYPDDVKRFIFFSRAVFEYIVRYQQEEFVLHCSDWQTALLAAYVKMYWPSYQRTPRKVVFTIHNLAYQGIGSKELFRLVNLPGHFFTHEYLEYFGNMNLLKAGLVFSDLITTVSPTYAKEIATPEFGEGLDGLIRALSLRKRILGIVNGIDTENLDPSSDDAIPFHYQAGSIENKLKNKKIVLEQFFPGQGEKLFTRPLVSCISRLVEQKGLDLLLTNPDSFFETSATWLFSGVGEPSYEGALKKLEKKYPRVRTILRFDEHLSRLLYAASDMLIMPSRFEPCGISQMIAMRYGTLPLVRRVGGLNDTVVDFPFNANLNTGFQFDNYRSDDCFLSFQRALAIYNTQRDMWNVMVNNAMESDFSWERPVERYAEMYLH